MIPDIIRLLKKEYAVKYYYSEPFKVLITTILSQRTRDENTELASKRLFKKYKSVKILANAKKSDVEKLIKPSGFYHVKAGRIIEVSKDLLKRFKGEVPDNLDDLLSLKGVGRKTANCVLVYAFKKPAVPVDVHVHRISNRLGLVNTKTPEQTEKELIKLLPKKYWLDINDLFVQHGRKICKPIRPLCYKCNLKKHCKYYKNK